MIFRRGLTLMALAVLMVATLSVSGCARHRTPEERADRFVQEVAKDLDLTDEQKAKLTAVKDAMLAARAQSRQEHDALFQDALAMVQSPHLDQAKALQLIERHQALQRQAAPPVIAKLAEFHDALTPEQRGKAVERLKRFHAHMQEHD